MRLNGKHRLMKTLVLLKSNPAVHMLFLIMNTVAIGEEERDFFPLLIWHTSQISFNQNLSTAKYNPCPFCSSVFFVLYLCSSRRKGRENGTIPDSIAECLSVTKVFNIGSAPLCLAKQGRTFRPLLQMVN